ncbi:hypothetical protein AAG570_005399 [Ranatra chinensis]|uniref:ELYS beta-propeller domain-containing protein n=1 Tax=Ranatra chinensis TaxID=642074 RepID=A0ABD0YNX1_9HEMI
MDRVQKLTQCVDFKNFFADDGDDGTSAGCHEMFGEMFSNFEKTWVACGPRLAVINNSDCSLRSAWTFGAGQNDLKPVIKCVVELCVSNCPSSLLLVGLEASLGYSLLCVYHPLSRRVIRTLKLDLNIRSMTIISDGDGLVNPLPDILDRLEGVLAIGSDNGLVVLVDLSRNFINGVLDGDFDSVVDESCPKKLCLIDCQTDSPATIHAKMEQCQNRGDSIAVPLNGQYTKF